MGRGISFLLCPICLGWVAVSKWFSQLRLLGIVSLLDETILKRPWMLRCTYYGHKAKKEIPLPIELFYRLKKIIIHTN